MDYDNEASKRVSWWFGPGSAIRQNGVVFDIGFIAGGRANYLRLDFAATQIDQRQRTENLSDAALCLVC